MGAVCLDCFYLGDPSRCSHDSKGRVFLFGWVQRMGVYIATQGVCCRADVFALLLDYPRLNHIVLGRA